MAKMIHLTQYSNARKSYHIYYLQVLLMELFLVTDPPLIVIELLNFYGILFGGFLFLFLTGGVAVKKQNKTKQHYEFPFSSHESCSIST